MVNTKHVKDRRSLHFTSPNDLFADVERLVTAEKAGRLRLAGNWTLGQNLGHLSAWMDYPYDGYPPELKAPWFVKAALRPFKKKFLRGPLRGGVRIPKLPNGTLATDRVETEEALRRLRASWERLRKAPPAVPNPVFGPMTHQEWVELHLRHAELHLGFMHP